jgi:hypothetical protein
METKIVQIDLVALDIDQYKFTGTVLLSLPAHL